VTRSTARISAQMPIFFLLLPDRLFTLEAEGRLVEGMRSVTP